MSQNYVDPINRGPVGAAGVAAGEGAKGAARGFFGGMIRGPIYGFLAGAAMVGAAVAIPTVIIGGLALALGASLPAVAIGAAVLPGLGGLVGAAGGTIAGGPLGALFGGLRGMGRGRDIVNHERGAAQVLETQQAIAQSQMMTAQALQQQAARPVIIQPASAPVVAPGFTVTSPAHQGQGVNLAQAVANDVGGMSHAQRVEAGRTQTSAEPARA
jgi:hypothetical protein